MGKIYYVGPIAGVADRLEAEFGTRIETGYPDSPVTGDVVFLAARAGGDVSSVPGGNAFAACRTLKQDPRVRVFLLIDEGDPYSEEIGRFCLADACLPLAADGSLGDLAIVRTSLRSEAGRVPVDELLESLEAELSADAAGQFSTIQRILGEDRNDSVLDGLTDPATGLFGGPFASFKLDEELKRAQRFHHPLSLILLDVGAPDEVLPVEGPPRDTSLAEIAAVFLNEFRDIDVLSRFTETTFLFLLPGTGSYGASAVTRRILDELRGRDVGGRQPLDPSAGMVTVPSSDIQHRSTFLARAEACLRLAQQGRGEAGLCVSSE